MRNLYLFITTFKIVLDVKYDWPLIDIDVSWEYNQYV